MKKLLIMVSALTAAVFSAAKADITASGSAGLHMVSGGDVHLTNWRTHPCVRYLDCGY